MGSWRGNLFRCCLSHAHLVFPHTGDCLEFRSSRFDAEPGKNGTYLYALEVFQEACLRFNLGICAGWRVESGNGVDVIAPLDAAVAKIRARDKANSRLGRAEITSSPVAH